MSPCVSLYLSVCLILCMQKQDNTLPSQELFIAFHRMPNLALEFLHDVAALQPCYAPRPAFSSLCYGSVDWPMPPWQTNDCGMMYRHSIQYGAG